MKKDSVYKKRLLKLADHLDTVKKKRFDFGKWVGDDWQGKPDLSCGTTACALGYATTIPSLRKAGLRLGKTSDEFGKFFIVYLKGKKIKESSAERAGMEVFGLTKPEFSYLFVPYNPSPFRSFENSPDEDAGPKEVSRHIRHFVEMKYGKKE